MFLRYIFGAIIAIFISLGLFYFMNFLISDEVNISKGNDDTKHMSFIRVKHEEPVDIRKRVMPKEPKEQIQPQKVKIHNVNNQTISQDIKIDMPKPTLSFDLAKDALSGVRVNEGLKNINASIAVNLMPIFKIPPRYPSRAKMLKKEGFVELEFTITKEGFVEDIVVTKSKPKKMFDSSAIRALSKWKFKPKIVASKPVAQKARQTINYTLK